MIGIVTVNWKGFDITMTLIKQVMESQYRDLRFIVVNNSAEDVEKFEREPIFDERISIIHSAENKGFSGGVNLGLRQLLPNPQISHFLIMNNDVELTPSFLTDMLEHAPRIDRIYSPLIFFRDTDLIYNTGGKVLIWLGGTINLNNHTPVSQLKKVTPDYFSGCILFMHREVLEKIGVFNEIFGTYYEDVDFCYRARENDIDMEMIWEIRARHFHSYATKGENTFKIYLLNRNQIIFARMHLHGLSRIVFISAAVVRGFLSNLKPKRFQHYWRGVKDGFSVSLEERNA